MPASAIYVDGCDQFTESDTYALIKFRLGVDEARSLIARIAPKWRGEAKAFGTKMYEDSPFELFLAGRDDDFHLEDSVETQTLRFEEEED